DVGGARAAASHAHVERPVEPERKSALGLVELHRGDAEIEHHAVDGRALVREDLVQIGKALFDQFEAAGRFGEQRRAAGDGALIAVDADDARTGRRQDGARKPACAERAVDVEAAVKHVEPFDGAADEHGNVASQSASDSMAAAARHYSRAPCGSSAEPAPAPAL